MQSFDTAIVNTNYCQLFCTDTNICSANEVESALQTTN